MAGVAGGGPVRYPYQSRRTMGNKQWWPPGPCITHPITNGHYLTLSVPCMCNVYWEQPGPSNQLAAAYQANRYERGVESIVLILNCIAPVVRETSTYSLTHNQNVSVREKAKKILPVCGMFNISRCWCWEAVNSLDTDKIPDCAFYTGEGTGAVLAVLARRTYNHNFISILHL